MSLLYAVIGAIAGLAVGFPVGYALLARSKKTKASIEADKIRAEATAKAEKSVADSRAESGDAEQVVGGSHKIGVQLQSRPRYRVWRRPSMVFIQPKISSTRWCAPQLPAIHK